MKNLLNYQVFDQLPVREWVPSNMQIRQYAEASGDFNPIHLDDNYARQAGLKGVIAQGMLTMAQMAAMLTDWIGQEGWIAKLNVRFEEVVRPGDKITCSGSIRVCSENTLVCDLEAFNEKKERVMSGLAHITIKC
ncbi:MaoC/PaaZ C-terminal domain-containing protein [Desulfosporosinus sp. BICA1-9]|uniref:MaoC/PaaZ C-terminal domain-containing protein n=1 Tax=Desulfosporosinus sp. BICA1-9 TaxID=1531958 RepID=UPI00054BC765|nr:MaoC/PaaZ C-terminal domain-containing protein [Desulfosporosinus sp. BICA1-9]KJS48492.1 MAG: acyl dehydratase [Peptococcaceae bacterium BRH_c23]KJS90674.1 MAG: acyl dehydratase [Desulfosporosinus sp. BICA1-9]HBW34941.1 acyl dehydratase [Desulfosporosinus sp.]